jgi:E3 ubiquitin-protein ligase HUWE1
MCLGIDAGGLRREYYTILTKQMFNEDYALFIRTTSTSNIYMPNPHSNINPDHLEYFYFIGKIIDYYFYKFVSDYDICFM